MGNGSGNAKKRQWQASSGCARERAAGGSRGRRQPRGGDGGGYGGCSDGGDRSKGMSPTQSCWASAQLDGSNSRVPAAAEETGLRRGGERASARGGRKRARSKGGKKQRNEQGGRRSREESTQQGRGEANKVVLLAMFACGMRAMVAVCVNRFKMKVSQ
eukprot:4922303-Pleurochrysis_carterae.AAC.1